MNSQSKMTERIFAAYQNALDLWRSGHYNEAQLTIKEIRSIGAIFPKLSLLEGFISRDKGDYLTELDILHHCLEELNATGMKDNTLAAEIWSMIGSAFYMLGETKKAIAAFSRSVDLEPDLGKRRIEASNAIFAANGDESYTPKDFYRLYKRYDALLSPVIPFSKRRYTHERLRVGYLSADFCGHPVGKLILPLLENHNKTKFKIYCYSAGDLVDDTTVRMRRATDIWKNIAGVSDETAAHIIYDDEIDVLIELGVHTKGNRLPILAYHPASVQICGIGDVRSSGLSCVDFFLSDIWCTDDTNTSRLDFTEQIIRLPHTHFCYTIPDNLPQINCPPCLSQGYITYGSFNNASKLTDEMLALWNRILQNVPQSRLLLKHKLFDKHEGCLFTKKRLNRLGFDLSRVELCGFSQDYLSQYNMIDIALDTYPYTGGFTTFDALTMGVPVISRYGPRHGTRFGFSILQNLDLGELTAPTKEKYVEIAVSLASDIELLTTLRSILRKRLASSPLTNAVQYTNDMENAYLDAIHKIFLEGNS